MKDDASHLQTPPQAQGAHPVRETVPCATCEDPIVLVRRDWWQVAQAWDNAQYALCSSSCAAAFFEEREFREGVAPPHEAAVELA